MVLISLLFVPFHIIRHKLLHDRSQGEMFCAFEQVLIGLAYFSVQANSPVIGRQNRKRMWATIFV